MQWYWIVAICLGCCLLLTGALELYLIKPNKKRDYSRFEGFMYAHRGLHDDIVPENSLAAFAAARSAGLGVELDVQQTKDNKLVVFHDEDLKHMCGADIKVRDLTFAELQHYTLKNSNETIPLFTQVLETLGDMKIICEIKYHNGMNDNGICQMVCDQIEHYPGDVCIESFSPMIVRWFAKHRPDIIRGQLSCNMMKDKSHTYIERLAMTNLYVNVISRPDFIAYSFTDIRAHGYCLCHAVYKPFCVAWTARGSAQQAEAKKHFTTIIFEKNER